MQKRQQDLVIPSGFEYLRTYLEKFTKAYPHLDRNVFIMMPFSGEVAVRMHQAISEALDKHGLIPLRADGRTFAPSLWWNVVTYMLGSSYGIVVYEPEGDIPFNPNVSIEAGFMSALDCPVLFLLNEYHQKLPVDWSGHLFKFYRPVNLAGSVADCVSDWVLKDLSYFDYGNKKVIVFVSLGGTCRCVLAKGLLSQKLHDAKIANIAVEAAAVADPHHATVSPSAIRALQEVGCDSWLVGHRPRKLSAYLQNRADLIVALTDGGLARSPESADKVVTDVELFGRKITNPYPDTEDDESLNKYRATRSELMAALEESMDQILHRVGTTLEI